MKIKKVIAGLAATTMALSTFAFSVSATKLGDVAYPSEENAEVNDAFYSIGAMGFFMTQEWAWNQGDWIGISDAGTIEVNYSISKVIADKQLDGTGTLGDMGVMIMNLPEGSYPYDITISDAKFVAEDGTETALDTVNAITEATLDQEGGFRIHIRPTDDVDADTNEVKRAATPEVVGWEVPGAFEGGVLSMTIDFGMDAAGDDGSSKGDESSSTGDDSSAKGDDSSSKGDDSATKDDNSDKKDDAADKKDDGAADGNKGDTTKPSTNGGNSDNTAAPDNSNAETGAESFALLGIALAGAAIVLTKKKN